MGLCQEVSEDLIEEVLSSVILKEKILGIPSLELNYSSMQLYNLRLNPEITFHPSTSIKITSFNSKTNRSGRGRKLQGFRKGKHYHLGGEIGDIKKTCFRKQAFDNLKEIP